jgi:dihydrofolate reductase
VNVTLYIATSLDGYIAGPDDDLSWLFTDADYGYSEFYRQVDALIMGRGTYEVVTKMGDWPYAGKHVVVVSRAQEVTITTSETEFHSSSLSALLQQLREKGYLKVWLVGGGDLVRSFLNESLVSHIQVSLHPILLGKGVPLFPGGFPRTLLQFEGAEAYESGLVQLSYSVPAEARVPVTTSA